MLPLTPEYSTSAEAERILGSVTFDGALRIRSDPAPLLTVAVPPFSASRHEIWKSPLPVRYGRRGAVAFGANEHVLVGAVAAQGQNLAQLTETVYGEIVATVREQGYPHLLRVWNYVRGINEGQGDEERYKQFCAGRYQALTSAGLEKRQFTASSAVGMQAGDLAVHFLAGRTPGEQVENPRQISAYDYPREHGLRAPSFSRATIARFGRDALLFVSGTASIVGHQTRHRGDCALQVDETLANLDAVVGSCRASLGDLDLVKVYIRRAEDAAMVTQRLRAAMPRARMLALQSDICRSELLIEVEAIALRPDAG